MRGDDDRDPIMIPRRWILGTYPAPASRANPVQFVCNNPACRATNEYGRHVVRQRWDGYCHCTDCGGIWEPGVPGIRGAYQRRELYQWNEGPMAGVVRAWFG